MSQLNRRQKEGIARVAHSINNDVRVSAGQSPSDVPTSVEAVEFILNSEGLTPRESHNSWREERLSQGWVYGRVYDAELKTHPNLHPDGYDALPEEERLKDYTFYATVKGIQRYIENESWRGRD